MSSLFSALTRAKDNTKQIVENASNRLSVKLQMNINSSPPMPHKYPSVSSSQISSISPKTENSFTENRSHTNKINACDLVNGSGNSNTSISIRYSEPCAVSNPSENSNVSYSDIKDFAIANSTEVTICSQSQKSESITKMDSTKMLITSKKKVSQEVPTSGFNEADILPKLDSFSKSSSISHLQDFKSYRCDSEFFFLFSIP